MIRVCRCAFYAFLRANQDARGELEVDARGGRATWRAADGTPIAQATRRDGEPPAYHVSPARAMLAALKTV